MPNGIFTLKQQAAAIAQGAWVGGKTPAVNYLVVAGGGGGGSFGGGGGGGGGLLQGNIGVSSGSAITVTVGTGGAGSGGGALASSGSSSVFGSIATTGGGGGGGGATTAQAVGANGGSGGGAAYLNTSTASSSIAGQGNIGGLSINAGAGYGGGGGGAGTRGLNATSSSGGNGGAGIASDISGTRTAYAGGGGAGDSGGVGGAGGGGNFNVAGAANTGGGGGAGQAGGSGIVIISYPDTYAAPTATTGSPTVSTSGAGSISFNGSNQYLVYPSSTNYAFGTGDFTVEMYVYRSNTSGIMLDARSGALSETWAMYCRSNTKLAWYTGPLDIETPSDIPLNTWAHVAVCRSGATTRLFINGNLETSFTDITNYTTTSTLKIGVSANLFGSFFGGNMSSIRITKGVALYTASFTPAPAPLTRGSNTVLLLNTVSGSAYVDSSGNATISSAANNPPWASSSPVATGLGYKNRVYTWTSSGSITF